MTNTEKTFVTSQKTISVVKSFLSQCRIQKNVACSNIHLEFVYSIHTFLYLLAFYLFFSYTVRPSPLLPSSHPHLPSKLDPLTAPLFPFKKDQSSNWQQLNTA